MSITFSPDGSHIASGSFDNRVRIWDGSFSSAGRDGQGPMSATLNSDIVLQSVAETKAMRTLDWLISMGGPRSCVLSRDSRCVVFGTLNGLVYVWGHMTNTDECVLRGHSGLVWSVAFSSDGSQVVSGSSDQTICIWDCDTESQISVYRDSHMVTSVGFLRNGSHVVFGSNNSVQIWNPATGQINRKLERDRCNVSSVAFNDSNVNSVTVSHDSKYVIYGSSRMAWIWNLMTNETNSSTFLSG
jgi:WD40 repeat protein